MTQMSDFYLGSILYNSVKTKRVYGYNKPILYLDEKFGRKQSKNRAKFIAKHYNTLFLCPSTEFRTKLKQKDESHSLNVK